MKQLRIIVCQVDDDKKSQMTELANFEFPAAAIMQLVPEKPPRKLQELAPARGHQVLQGLSQLAFLFNGWEL